MPKRTVKRVSWEVESERLTVSSAMERRIQRQMIKSAPEALRELERATSQEDTFYALPRATMAAFDLEQREVAKSLAERSLAVAEEFKGNWNHGNAIHTAHTVLGLLALRSGNVAAAVAALLASAQVTGSPQLGSFGPSMRLAKELLRHGESRAVLSYLHHCKQFWSMGETWIKVWEQKISRGAVPNFLMHCHR